MTKKTDQKRQPSAKTKGSAPESAYKVAAATVTQTKPNKLASIIDQISRSDGATLSDLMSLTGWQSLTVQKGRRCNLLAGGVRKKLGAKVVTKKVDGSLRYWAPASAPSGQP